MSEKLALRVLIADDHPVVRRGLKQILADDPSIGSFGEASNSQEALDMAIAQDWDVILLDLTMPGQGGVEVLKQIRAAKPQVPVLVVSMHPEEQFAVRVLKAGAAGYMTKESAPDELRQAISKVVRGGRYMSEALSERIAPGGLDRMPDREPHEALSDREYQVIRMIASGKAASDIARELNLSVKTISTYRTRILEKMRMKNNAELTHYAIQNKLVD